MRTDQIKTRVPYAHKGPLLSAELVMLLADPKPENLFRTRLPTWGKGADLRKFERTLAEKPHAGLSDTVGYPMVRFLGHSGDADRAILLMKEIALDQFAASDTGFLTVPDDAAEEEYDFQFELLYNVRYLIAGWHEHVDVERRRQQERYALFDKIRREEEAQQTYIRDLSVRMESRLGIQATRSTGDCMRISFADCEKLLDLFPKEMPDK